MVGSLQYLNLTRPHIFYYVNYLSQFLHKPTYPLLQVVKRVFRYLKGTKNFGLRFTPSLNEFTNKCKVL